MADAVSRSGSEAVIAAMSARAEHVATLPRAVESLLPQCDQLRVYLGDGLVAPPALAHPRISLRRAADWDERGSAACFSWMRAADPPGLRLMASAGVVYPRDFVAVLRECLARHAGRAIVGADGLLLRQTIGGGAAPRATPVASDRERAVHALSADALLFHSQHVDLDPEAFVGDPVYALSRYAQSRALPMVAVRHAADWLGRTGALRFPAAWPHDAKVATVHPFQRKTCVVLIVAHGAETLRRALAAWDVAAPGVELVLIVVSDGTDPDVRQAVGECLTQNELHVLPRPEPGADALFAGLTRAACLESDLLMVASDAVSPVSNGWAAAALALCDAPGAAFVCTPDAGGAGLRVGTMRRTGAVALLCARDVLARWRDADEGTALGADFQGLLGYAAPRGLALDRVAAFERAFSLSPAPPPAPAPPKAAASADRAPPLRIDDLFRRRLAINLDRRADRWALMADELSRAGVAAARFPAVDASAASVAARYALYRSAAPVTTSGAVRPIRDTRGFFSDYDSQRARAAYLERTEGEKAIRTAGAWGYLLSWRQILEAALRDGVETLLVFDDDVLFHRDAEALFAAAAACLPEDWLVLQLGTLQYHWSRNWITPYRSVLWRTNGVAIGSHAVGLRAPVFPYLLAQASRMEMPFDIGALSATVGAFRDRCFVTRPNIAIQRLGGDSDINSSEFQIGRSAEEIAATYRWRLADYPGWRSALAD